MWNMLLVNYNNFIDDDFEVLLADYQGILVDKRIIKDLDSMFNDMKKIGLFPVIISGYRSRKRQEYLFNRKVDYYKKCGYEIEECKRLACMLVARPNTSEHQIGLALDIVDNSYKDLEIDQENTDVCKWLMNNSYKYGFVLRYPKNKENITKVSYEPWHYRYVGRELASILFNNKITLEEYYNNMFKYNK